MTIISKSEDETQTAARVLASQLRAGDIVLLSGPLGAGKTAFVRGLAAGLGIDPGEVSSPTFTLLHEYRPVASGLTLYHADLYRLERAETEDLGLEETDSGVLAVEWPERLAALPPGAIAVAIAIVDERTREITMVDRSG